jgi:uncharacterized protein YcbK (DUF882 family)
LPRAGLYAGLSSLMLLAAAGSVKDATAEGETRTLSFHHTHSDEDLTVTFKRNGRYDEEALKQLNHFLRDWRSQDETVMDRHLFDIIWEVYRDVGGRKPIQIISAYRSPATNAMLRRRSSGVARFSQHMLGHAMDFFIPDVPLEQIRFAGLRLQRGGVGFYPTSGSPFVHLDVGNIRMWPRMTHDQLAKVFPDGRTVYLPSDGKPLAGYDLAMADIEKRSGDDASTVSKPGLFAALFRGKSNDDEDEGAAPAQPAEAKLSDGKASDSKASDVKASDVKMAAAKPADPIPMPRAKPAMAATFQLASADAQIVATPRPSKPATTSATAAIEAKPGDPADIINSRGFWGDTPSPAQATPAQLAALKAREALTAATDPQPTSSVSALQAAMAYAPPTDRARTVASSAPMPRSQRSVVLAQNSAAPAGVTTVVAKGAQGQPSVVATRPEAAPDNNVWMRAMILARSVSTMTSTVFGDLDLTAMRAHFVKPQVSLAMGFSDDPQSGLVSDQFTGPAVAKLTTMSFVVQTAALR